MIVEMVLSNAAVELIADYRAWVEAEWGAVDSFAGSADLPLPAPILALADGQLVGGLSFTHSCLPDTQETVIWINTLLVAPAFRHQGIGSALIKAAERSVAAGGSSELYVFTSVAPLYQQLGWRIQDHAADGCILRKELSA
jgi:predicted N-acetyltransferase YhbS